MRFLVLGDWHLSDKAPSLRTDTWADDLLDKGAQAVQIAQEYQCNGIVSAGDVFHIKAPSRTSHALVQRTGKVLTAAGIPVLIVPGNHDLSNDRLDSLKKQPLGTLAKMEGIELLIGPHNEFPLFGLPYLHDWRGMLPDWMRRFREWGDERKGEDFDFLPLMVTHAPIFPDHENPPYEYIKASVWAGMAQHGDCYYGHIHDPHGAYTPDPALPVVMCNNGALSRGSLHKETLKREPAVTVWDSEAKGEARFIRVPLQVRPVDAVFRMNEKDDIDEKTNRVEAFLENIGSTTLDAFSIEEVAHQAEVRGLRPETRALVSEILESV